MNGSSSLDFRRDGNVFDWTGPDQHHDGLIGTKRHTCRMWRGTQDSEENPRSCPVPWLSGATRHIPGLAPGIREENRPRVKADRVLLCLVIYDVFWERELIEWFISRGQSLIWKGSSVMRNRPRWVASMPPRDTVMSGPKLLAGSMSRFMTLM